MKWVIDDDGSYDRVWVRETDPRPGNTFERAICQVLSAAAIDHEPTDADREEMLATAREIIESHNAKETK